MLEGEDGGRHENGDLLAREDGLEGGTEGHLGLAEADIAAEEAVHRDVVLHIPLDVADGTELAVGLDVGEGFLKFALAFVVGREGVARAAHPRGVEGDEILGHILLRLLNSRRFRSLTQK